MAGEQSRYVLQRPDKSVFAMSFAETVAKASNGERVIASCHHETDAEAIVRAFDASAEIAQLTAERDNFAEQAAIRSDSFNECQRVMAAHNETITGLADLQSRYDSLADERNEIIARNLRLNSEIAALQSIYDALLAERAVISEAFRFNTPTDALYNLEGALRDLDQMEADPICRATIRRVIKQLSPLRAALATPIEHASPPPDWDDIRGLAPHATGSLSSEGFIRNSRDEWDAASNPPEAV